MACCMPATAPPRSPPVMFAGYGAAEVAAGDVCRHDDAAAHVFAVYRVRTGGRYDTGYLSERDFSARSRVDGQVFYFVDSKAPAVARFQRKRDCHAVFVNLRNGFAFQCGFHPTGKVGQRDAVARQHFTAGDDLQLRPLHLLLHANVGDALDTAHRPLDLLSERIHTVEVFAEQFDGDIRLRAREHGVDAVRNGLPYLHVDAFYGGEAAAHVRQKFFAAAVGEYERRFELRRIDAERVFVELGTTGLAGDGFDFGDFEQNVFDQPSDFVGLIE